MLCLTRCEVFFFDMAHYLISKENDPRFKTTPRHQTEKEMIWIYSYVEINFLTNLQFSVAH